MLLASFDVINNSDLKILESHLKSPITARVQGLLFLKRWAIPGLLFFILVFSIVQLADKILQMTGFEPRISGVGSDRSTN